MNSADRDDLVSEAADAVAWNRDVQWARFVGSHGEEGR